MARFAPGCPPSCAGPEHPIAKLIFVWIRMAGRARQIGEVVSHRFIRRCCLMAIAARHSHVPAGQDERTLLMAIHGERGRPEVRLGVALLAAVQVRRSRKLALVRVFVAIGTERELHLVKRRFPGRLVALCAVHAEVPAAQRKSCVRMVPGEEFRRLPFVYSVAALALASVCSFCELAVVWIRLVAVRAQSVCDWRFEIPATMTGVACNLNVLSCQSELCFGVVELTDERRLFP